MPQENEILQWNTKILERHDRDIEVLKDHCSTMNAELKVIKLFSGIIVTILGLVGSIVVVFKMLHGAL